MVNQAEVYINQVLNGDIVVGKWQLLAVKRHLKDLEEGESRGLHFNKQAGIAAIELIKKMPHTIGKWANKPFQLTNWQSFCVYSLFGWQTINSYIFLEDWGNWRMGMSADLKDAEDLPVDELYDKKIVAKKYVRRFKKAFFEMAKKNGKTEFAAAIANLLLMLNGDEAAEYYWAATTFSQASIGWTRQKAMIDKLGAKNKYFRRRFGTNSKRIFDNNNRSNVLPLAKETERSQKDGIAAKGGFIDEYHLHDNNYLITQLESSSALYDDALILIITTAGYNPYCVCKEFEDLCKAILSGTVENDEIFAIIFQLDDGDDWENEEVWVKANPNIGESPTWKFMKNEYEKAKLEGGASLTTFLVKNLNWWTKNREIWIDVAVWQKNHRKYTHEQLKDLPCWGGLDLAAKNDFNAKTLLWELPNGEFYTETTFWIPEDTLKVRRKKARGIDFEKWVQQGYIKTVPGNYMEFSAIADEIKEDLNKFNIQHYAFDSWMIENVMIHLVENNLEFLQKQMHPFRQGHKSMNEPTTEVEKWINTHKLTHNNNKCMEWQLTNVHLERNASDWVKINKQKSVDKVDGPVSLVMAVGCYIATKGNVHYEKVLENRDIIF